MRKNIYHMEIYKREVSFIWSSILTILKITSQQPRRNYTNVISSKKQECVRRRRIHLTKSYKGKFNSIDLIFRVFTSRVMSIHLAHLICSFFSINSVSDLCLSLSEQDQ